MLSLFLYTLDGRGTTVYTYDSMNRLLTVTATAAFNFRNDLADFLKLFDSGSGGSVNIFDKGKKVFDNFNIDDAYVKPKHLSTTKGGSRQFLGSNKTEAEGILKDAMKNGNITSISDNGLTPAGNQSYEIIIDAGKTIGTRGENLIKIILSEDGGMLSAYPIK